MNIIKGIRSVILKSSNVISSNKVFSVTILVLWAALTATLVFGLKGVLVSAEQRLMASFMAEIEPMKKDIAELNERDLISIRRDGVAAYQKFDGLEGEDLFAKLESSTLSTAAALAALEIPEIYDELYQYNRPLTIALKEYFGIG